uniref:Putative ORF1 n=1 Tax=Rodent picobirnavirus TaxID=2863997 RepID=A0A8K1HHE1_9VIRU|nr:putative ORF1 [Rodent picobirnavirus]
MLLCANPMHNFTSSNKPFMARRSENGFFKCKTIKVHRAIKGLLDEVKLCIGFAHNNIQKEVLHMTANQIAYWANQEKARNNRAVEKETNRSNLAREAETNRANVAKETETHRANVRNEWLRMWENIDTNIRFKQSLDETKRQNRVNEDLARKQFEESKRRNLSTESISRYEAETKRYQQQETARANRIGEAQKRDTINEQARSNVRNENLKSVQAAETHRANLAYEEFRLANLSETERANLANENLKRFQNTLQYSSLLETERHNQATEHIDATRNRIQLFTQTLHEANQFYQGFANRRSQEGRTLMSIAGGMLKMKGGASYVSQ